MPKTFPVFSDLGKISPDKAPTNRALQLAATPGITIDRRDNLSPPSSFQVTNQALTAKMRPLALLTLFLPLALPTSAALVDLYEDANCQKKIIGDQNVWDNSCAVWKKHKFKSYNITYPGGPHQKLHPFDYSWCVGWQKKHCFRAVVDKTCHRADFHEEGYSYAMGSCMLCSVF
ncbi:hypothetical protein B0T16DRAFT_455706 [Cercophora newfieldiana]|uniref:Uncharacterized protein n=1 Tax=Cercophora newfieldiana TaxID=92897 RepID=A0AA39Y9I9_9PEZI|nr:hypothetical protein B0T16DRAFT_455706 [Cercophora newfieldiana]